MTSQETWVCLLKLWTQLEPDVLRRYRPSEYYHRDMIGEGVGFAYVDRIVPVVWFQSDTDTTDIDFMLREATAKRGWGTYASKYLCPESRSEYYSAAVNSMQDFTTTYCTNNLEAKVTAYLKGIALSRTITPGLWLHRGDRVRVLGIAEQYLGAEVMPPPLLSSESVDVFKVGAKLYYRTELTNYATKIQGGQGDIAKSWADEGFRTLALNVRPTKKS